jgi:hypothetical protein
MDFHWPVAVGGHQWVDHEKERLLCAIDALQPDWNYSADRYIKQYRPLEERSGLFWEFAALEATEEAVRQFADKFGLLGASSEPQVRSQSGLSALRPESLALWEREIEALQRALMLWRATTSCSKKLQSELKAKMSPRDAPLAIQSYLHMDHKDPAMFLLGAVQRITDPHLNEQVLTRVLFAGNTPRLKLVLQPQSLLSALWLQFAAAVDAQKSFSKCQHCSVPFEVSRDISGKRRSARFCSVRCRVSHYRGRIDQARQLNSAGRPAGEIARVLNTRVSTVRNWLATKAPSETGSPGSQGH